MAQRFGTKRCMPISSSSVDAMQDASLYTGITIDTAFQKYSHFVQ